MTHQPVLQAWLDMHEAKLQSEEKVNASLTVYKYVIGEGIAYIETYAGKGWQIYTALPSNDIRKSLSDAAKRLGIHTGVKQL